MDKGFALPCHHNIEKTIKPLSQKAVMITLGSDMDLSFLLPQSVPN